MATERQVPGGPYVNETATAERQIPGGQYINETVAAAGGEVNRIRFPAQVSAMGVGGQLGGNRVN